MAGLLAWAADVVGGGGQSNGEEDEGGFPVVVFTPEQAKYARELEQRAASLRRSIQDLRLRIPPPHISQRLPHLHAHSVASNAALALQLNAHSDTREEVQQREITLQDENAAYEKAIANCEKKIREKSQEADMLQAKLKELDLSEIQLRSELEETKASSEVSQSQDSNYSKTIVEHLGEDSSEQDLLEELDVKKKELIYMEEKVQNLENRWEQVQQNSLKKPSPAQREKILHGQLESLIEQLAAKQNQAEVLISEIHSKELELEKLDAVRKKLENGITEASAARNRFARTGCSAASDSSSPSSMSAFRAVAAARPPTTPSSAPKSAKSIPCFKPPVTSLAPLTSTTISLFSLFSSPNDAKAFSITKDQIVSSLTDVENAIGQVVEFGSNVLGYSKQLVDALKPGIDAATPVLKQAGSKALEIASPAISEASKQAKDALQSAGVDTSPVLGAAKTIADAAQQAPKVIQDVKPIASSTLETITSSDPQTIAVTAGAVVLAYFLFPPVWSVISFNLRGYKGNLTPAQALDMITAQNYLLIDIRSEKDKGKSGIPRLPSNARNKIISIPLEELPSKIRSLVKNSKKVEAEMAAIKISYLKKLNKSSNIVIMDSYSDSAKIVARVLTGLGFKNCWIMSDGFSGSKGWLQSRLGTDSYNFSVAEVLSPSRVISSAARVGTAFQSTQKLLPGSD
ncbi:hypothetical protein H6P81_008669 [Aristolochia fimbriata]|uniref:Rhodanese domain-containing protein n=1 Tax=Aristolochia fimbriata TaxID=158543 RepID=A0AAV7EK41_ARIFI|nr:hypothetical protein H6P81_008669 [Aristolochia fimbriata]